MVPSRILRLHPVWLGRNWKRQWCAVTYSSVYLSLGWHIHVFTPPGRKLHAIPFDTLFDALAVWETLIDVEVEL